MHKRLYIAVAVLVLITATGVIYSRTQADTANISANTTRESTDTSARQQGTTVTKEGVMICLQPKAFGGTQATTCALGMMVNGGVAYALQSSEPGKVGSIPTGTHVRITGTLITGKSTTYESAGTIKVQFLQRL